MILEIVASDSQEQLKFSYKVVARMVLNTIEPLTSLQWTMIVDEPQFVAS